MEAKQYLRMVRRSVERLPILRQKKQAELAEAEHKEKMEEAWINAMAKNGFTGQFNFLTGKDATAPFLTTPMGGDKQ